MIQEKRHYLSGPMTGFPDYNQPLFNAAAACMRSAGLLVENPAEPGQIEGWSWSQYMKRALTQMMLCDEVWTLPGWEKSPGASEEVRIARVLGMRIRHMSWWLTLDPLEVHGYQEIATPYESLDAISYSSGTVPGRRSVRLSDRAPSIEAARNLLAMGTATTLKDKEDSEPSRPRPDRMMQPLTHMCPECGTYGWDGRVVPLHSIIASGCTICGYCL